VPVAASDDEDHGDELGVHHESCSQTQLRSLLNVTKRDPFVPSPVSLSQTVLSPCST